MPVLQPDTTDMVDLAAIPPGTYPARITEAKTQQSKGEGGKPKVWMVVPKFAITVDGKNRVRSSYLPVSGEGTYGFDQLLRAVHLEDLADAYKDPTISPKPDFDTDTLIGQELMVVIDTQLYQKKDNQGNAVGEPEVRDQVKTFLKA